MPALPHNSLIEISSIALSSNSVRRDSVICPITYRFLPSLLIGDTVFLFCLIFYPPIDISQIADTIISTIQMFYRIIAYCISKIKHAEGKGNMALTQKRILILCIIIIIAGILGRLAIRAVMNFILGGTMFGGNFL